MIEDYDNMEKLTVARQMYQALAVAWHDRDVSDDERNMLNTFGSKALGIDEAMRDRLSKQYIRMQGMVYDTRDCREVYYKESEEDQRKGKRSMIPVSMEDRTINPQVLHREFTMFVQLADNTYTALSGTEPTAAVRSSEHYQTLMSAMIPDFGMYYYLVHKSPSMDFERVSKVIAALDQGDVSPMSVGSYHLPHHGPEFERVECAIVNRLEEGALRSGSDKMAKLFGKQPQEVVETAVQKFFAHRFGKEYEPEEFFRTRSAIRVSGTQLNSVIRKALLGYSDLFRDAVDVNSMSLAHIDRMRQYKNLSEDGRLAEETQALLRDAAELELENAYLVGLTERQHKRIEPKRPGQFNDLKHMVDVLEVMLDDEVITTEETDLFMKMVHDSLGMSYVTTRLLLDDALLNPKSRMKEPVKKIDEEKARILVAHKGLRSGE